LPYFLRPITFVVGILLTFMSVLMLTVAAFAASQHDPESQAFLISAAFTGCLGGAIAMVCRGHKFELVARQLYLLTSVSWIVMSLAAALPLYLSKHQIGFIDAVFEAVSGITTTGSTVLSGLDDLPHSLLLWRSLIQWLGGLGVIGMAVSILPFLQVGGMRLFQTESSDWSDKSMPRLQILARMLLLFYLGISCLCTSAYWLAGMELFDAVNHAMTTVSTGGFATSDQSMGRFSIPILWVSITFMLLGALPFGLIVSSVRDRGRSIIGNQQVLGLALAVLAFAMPLSLYLVSTGQHLPVDGLTHATFNLVSVITTTGYASQDYTQWGSFSIALFFIATFIGGCSGSTSGGMKIFRFQLSYLFLRSQIQRLIHPSGIFVTRYNRKLVDDDIIVSAVAFSFLFFICVAAVTLALALMGLDLLTSLSSATTALTNVGPGLGDIVGPAGNFSSLPEAAKWVLCIAMLLGRLELMTLMVLFTPMFWRA
jgi:trk system potassium uptake protein TrkH